MSNKIDGLTPRPAPDESGRVQRGRAPGPAEEPSDAALDSVTLTDEARLLQRAEAHLAETPDVDRERVESIKEAIADGRYRVNAEQVATQVLRMEQQLAGL